MRAAIMAAALFLAIGSPADAQNCTRAWNGTIKCTDGSSLSPTWSGGYQSNGGTTWSQNPLGNGWNSNNGGTIRQNSYGNYTTGGGSTWSQTPLDGGYRSSGGKTCTRGLLDNVVCR